MLKAVLFDLDGTLLPMNEDEFTKGYFGLLCQKLQPLGYEPEKLVKSVWTGTKLMIKNDGSKTNENVFWNCFCEIYGSDKIKDKLILDDFYKNDFKKAKAFCGESEISKKIVSFAKNCGLKVVLASNPVFPRAGMITRMGFVGLNENDFDYITSYENSHYSKPNPKYYEEILKNIGVKPSEAIMFGNNQTEDFEASSKVGIKAFLTGNENDFESAQVKLENIFDVIKKNLEKN